MSGLAVRPVSADEHLAFVDTQRSASFLQTPAWGAVKSEWRRESLGWFDGETMVGSALVLYRQLPKVKRFLASVDLAGCGRKQVQFRLPPPMKHRA